MPDETPTVAGELRALRDAAGLGQPKLAKTLGISQSKLSRIELAQGSAEIELVTAWLETCLPMIRVRAGDDELPVRVHRQVTAVLARADQPGYLAFLTRLLEDERTEVVSAYTIYREGMQHRQARLYAEHQAATSLRMVEPVHIPGPLQTRAYAERIFALDADHTAATATQIDEALSHRVAYGRRLRSGDGPLLHAVVTENAIDMPMAGAAPDLRAGVIEHLIAMAASPTVTVQVLPRAVPVPCMVLAGFVIVTGPAGEVKVLVETYSAQLAFTAERDIAEYDYRWRTFTAAALNPDESLAWLQQRARTT